MKIKLLFAILFMMAYASAATRRIVPSSTYSTITAALAASKSGDTVWVCAGTYTEVVLKIPKGVVMVGGFPASPTTPSQRIYPGAASASQLSTLDGQYAHRVAVVRGTLDGFAIKKGYTYINGSDTLPGYGGGLLVDGGVVQNCLIHDNVASSLEPLPGNIPGTFSASVGDIYCSDGTILKPTYSVGVDGVYTAALNASAFTGHTPMGIVFYVNPAATSHTFYIMGMPPVNPYNTLAPDASYTWINTSPATDMPTVPNYTTVAAASADTAGFSNTNKIVIQGQAWAASGTPWTDFGSGTDNPGKSAVKYARYYDVPTGTVGRWYLPAAAQILQVFDVYPQMNAAAKLIVNNGFWPELASVFATNGTKTIFPCPGNKYWTSTEYDAANAWVLNTAGYPWGTQYLDKADKTAGSILTIPITTIKL